MTDYIYFVIVLAIVFTAGLIVLASCLSYHKGVKDALEEERKNGREMSPEEFQEFIKTITPVEKDLTNQEFMQLVQDCIDGKHDNDPPMQNDPLVDVSMDCEGYECAASPNREDCCHSMGNDGRCHVIININQLCGIESIVKKPDLLSQEEVNLLAQALKEYDQMKEAKRTIVV